MPIVPPKRGQLAPTALGPNRSIRHCTGLRSERNSSWERSSRELAALPAHGSTLAIRRRQRWRTPRHTRCSRRQNSCLPGRVSTRKMTAGPLFSTMPVSTSMTFSTPDRLRDSEESILNPFKAVPTGRTSDPNVTGTSIFCRVLLLGILTVSVLSSREHFVRLPSLSWE